jgi:hypothetical protein
VVEPDELEPDVAAGVDGLEAAPLLSPPPAGFVPGFDSVFVSEGADSDVDALLLGA